jgi:hypothetical protein
VNGEVIIFAKGDADMEESSTWKVTWCRGYSEVGERHILPLASFVPAQNKDGNLTLD